MFVSVIVATYNRLDSLLRLLESLRFQVYKDFEVIVADNAAQPEVRAAVDALAEEGTLSLRYVPEKQKGKHYAVNAGVKASCGELLVFTDDDATVDPQWISAYVEAFRNNSDLSGAGGRVDLAWEQEPPQWLVDFIGDRETFGLLSMVNLHSGFFVSGKISLYGVNMAFRRDVYVRAGGYNPECYGDIWLGDGDNGLQRKAEKQGAKIGYVPDARVNHHIPASRMTPAYLWRRMLNEGAAQLYTHCQRNGKMPSRMRMLKHAAALGVRNSLLVLRGVAARGRTGRKALELQHRAAFILGRLVFAFRLGVDAEVRRIAETDRWIGLEYQHTPEES